jgi:hypothetical protein
MTDRKTTCLATLEAELASQIELFAYPARVWPPQAVAGAHDVVIIGAGQAGIAVAFGLLRERITNFLLVDRSLAGREGPWMTWARMLTLRTVKELWGPENGVPAASFRQWYEATHGADAWARLVRIPKSTWMDYLLWLRHALCLPVLNETEVISVTAEKDGLSLVLRDQAGCRQVQTRKLVLATGIDGIGGKRVPPFAAALPSALCAHSADMIDFAALAGKNVAVLGAGASAFDNAATALEAGARSVTQFVRRPALPEVNALRFLEFRGFFRHYGALEDAQKLRFLRRYLTLPVPPPADTLERCRKHDNFALRFGEAWDDVQVRGGGLAITTKSGTTKSGTTKSGTTKSGTTKSGTTKSGVFTADFAILGTGFCLDLAAVPYLAPLLAGLVTWGDRVSLAEEGVEGQIARYPYLDATMRASGRTEAEDHVLRNVFFLNGAGVASVGPICSGINGLPWGAASVVAGISRDLFCADADQYLDHFMTYNDSDANENYR